MRSIRSTGSERFDDHLRAIRLIVVGTALTDTYRARRNARQKMFAQLRRLRTVFETTFPALPRDKPISRTVLKTARGKLERLRQAGWKDWVGDDEIKKFAAAGVRIRSVKITAAQSGDKYDRVYYFIPAWAAVIGPNKPSELRAAKRSTALRKAVVVAEALS